MTYRAVGLQRQAGAMCRTQQAMPDVEPILTPNPGMKIWRAQEQEKPKILTRSWNGRPVYRFVL